MLGKEIGLVKLIKIRLEDSHASVLNDDKRSKTRGRVAQMSIDQDKLQKDKGHFIGDFIGIQDDLMASL